MADFIDCPCINCSRSPPSYNAPGHEPAAAFFANRNRQIRKYRADDLHRQPSTMDAIPIYVEQSESTLDAAQHGGHKGHGNGHQEKDEGRKEKHKGHGQCHRRSYHDHSSPPAIPLIPFHEQPISRFPPPSPPLPPLVGFPDAPWRANCSASPGPDSVIPLLEHHPSPPPPLGPPGPPPHPHFHDHDHGHRGPGGRGGHGGHGGRGGRGGFEGLDVGHGGPFGGGIYPFPGREHGFGLESHHVHEHHHVHDRILDHHPRVHDHHDHGHAGPHQGRAGLLRGGRGGRGGFHTSRGGLFGGAMPTALPSHNYHQPRELLDHTWPESYAFGHNHRKVDLFYFMNNADHFDGAAPKAPWRPAMSEFHGTTAYVLEVVLPGTQLKDIHLAFTDVGSNKFKQSSLSITGCTPPVRETVPHEAYGGTAMSAIERFGGPFVRVAKFDEPVDGEAITAKLEAGLLTITIPKICQAKNKDHDNLGKSDTDSKIGDMPAGHKNIVLQTGYNDESEVWQMEPGSPESATTIQADTTSRA